MNLTENVNIYIKYSQGCLATFGLGVGGGGDFMFSVLFVVIVELELNFVMFLCF